jgi:hypothetical protein
MQLDPAAVRGPGEQAGETTTTDLDGRNLAPDQPSVPLAPRRTRRVNATSPSAAPIYGLEGRDGLVQPEASLGRARDIRGMILLDEPPPGTESQVAAVMARKPWSLVSTHSPCSGCSSSLAGASPHSPAAGSSYSEVASTWQIVP